MCHLAKTKLPFLLTSSPSGVCRTIVNMEGNAHSPGRHSIVIAATLVTWEQPAIIVSGSYYERIVVEQPREKCDNKESFGSAYIRSAKCSII